MDNKDKSLLKTLLSDLKKIMAPQKFISAKLVDGSEVESEGDAFTVGQTLYVIGEDGQKAEAPVGTHQLETGEILEVSEGGKIESVEMPEMATEDKKPEEMGNEKIEALEKEVASLKESVSSLVSKFESASKDAEANKASFKKLIEIVEQIAEQPASLPIQESTKTTLSATSDTDVYENIAKSLKTLKRN